MFIKEYTTNRFKSIEQFKVGEKAVKGKSVTEIAVENEVSRQYVYEQKAKLEEQIEEIKNEITGSNVKEIKIDDAWLKKVIIWLALDCSSSEEGIQNFLEKALEIKISIGSISNVLKEASERAKRFDETISLGGIKVGANDEIFQCNEPVLTGIDPTNTYIYLMTKSDDRTGEAWKKAFEKLKEAGLKLEISVNDGGSGLNKGIPMAYPNIKIQADVFHAIHDIGKAVSALERKAMNSINQEVEMEKKLLNERVQNRTYEKYEKVEAETRKAIYIYDIVYILYMWLRELLGITGYEINDLKELIEYVMRELELVCDAVSLKKGVKFIRGCLVSF